MTCITIDVTQKSDMELTWYQLKSVFFNDIHIRFGSLLVLVVILLFWCYLCRTARCNEMHWSRSCPNSFSGWKVHAKRSLEPRIIGAAKTRIVGSDGVSTWLIDVDYIDGWFAFDVSFGWKIKKPYVGIELIASFWLWSLCHLYKLYVNLVDFYSIVLFCLVTVGMTDRLWPYLRSLLIYHNYVSSMNALQCIHMS